MDLVSVFERGALELLVSSRRGDEDEAHVSDLGKCLFQTYLRRSGAEKAEPSLRSAQLLMKGLHDEKFVMETLQRGLPARYVAIRPDDIREDLTGHIDIILLDEATGYRRLVEVKTTTWREKDTWLDLGEISGKTGKPIKTRVRTSVGPYPKPSTAYRLQAIGYCQRQAVNTDGKHMPYTILQWDRNLNGIHQYPAPSEWYDSDEPEWLALHDKWTREVIDLTDPSKNPVAMGIAIAGPGGLYGRPPEDWMCSYCDYTQCASNRSSATTVAEEEAPF